jgi:hypothetical protein
MDRLDIVRLFRIVPEGSAEKPNRFTEGSLGHDDVLPSRVYQSLLGDYFTGTFQKTQEHRGGSGRKVLVRSVVEKGSIRGYEPERSKYQ